MTFDPSQETLEEYLRRISMERKPCCLRPAVVFSQHGQTKKNRATETIALGDDTNIFSCFE